MKTTILLLLISLGSVANAAPPYFKCEKGTLLDSDGQTKHQAYFRFVPSTLKPGTYITERGADRSGGYGPGNFASYEMPSDLVQLKAETFAADTFQGRPVRTFDIHVIAQRPTLDGSWTIQHSVRVQTRNFDKTYIDTYQFTPQDCGWY